MFEGSIGSLGVYHPVVTYVVPVTHPRIDINYIRNEGALISLIVCLKKNRGFRPRLL